MLGDRDRSPRESNLLIVPAGKAMAKSEIKHHNHATELLLCESLYSSPPNPAPRSVSNADEKETSFSLWKIFRRHDLKLCRNACVDNESVSLRRRTQSSFLVCRCSLSVAFHLPWTLAFASRWTVLIAIAMWVTEVLGFRV